MIKCFEANYPESLGAVLVYRAPWIFTTVWSLIRGWLDPVVAGKVHFVKTPEELESYVPKSQIPTELGGDEKWEYSYVEPQEGENDLMKDTAARKALQSTRAEIVKKYEAALLGWIHDAPEEAEALKQRREQRDAVAEELRTNYWKLDPYVRARTLYERLGVLQEAGKLDFYPKKQVEKEGATATSTPAQQETSPDDLD
jgi:hypothetical protein